MALLLLMPWQCEKLQGGEVGEWVREPGGGDFGLDNTSSTSSSSTRSHDYAPKNHLIIDRCIIVRTLRSRIWHMTTAVRLPWRSLRSYNLFITPTFVQ
jgi:hypothetical protein